MYTLFCFLDAVVFVVIVVKAFFTLFFSYVFFPVLNLLCVTFYFLCTSIFLQPLFFFSFCLNSYITFNLYSYYITYLLNINYFTFNFLHIIRCWYFALSHYTFYLISFLLMLSSITFNDQLLNAFIFMAHKINVFTWRPPFWTFP